MDLLNRPYSPHHFLIVICLDLSFTFFFFFFVHYTCTLIVNHLFYFVVLACQKICLCDNSVRPFSVAYASFIASFLMFLLHFVRKPFLFLLFLFYILFPFQQNLSLEVYNYLFDKITIHWPVKSCIFEEDKHRLKFDAWWFVLK